MPTQKCAENIAQEAPPFNIPCTGAFCAKTRPARDSHCQTFGLDPDTPQLSFDPALNSSCYCCCSCYTLNTPIAVAKDEFALIQDIVEGDTILTTGSDLVWRPGKVESRSGEIEPSMISGLYLVRYKMDGEQNTRDLIVTADHLFMMASDQKLKKVQELIPNNGLLSADGTIARVVFVVYGDYDTAIQSIQMEGTFDGKNLDGHLINANGIVSTDFKVQAFYEIQGNKSVNSWAVAFGKEDEIVNVGEPDYVARFNCDEIGAFLDDKKQWPKGFMPKRQQLINIPENAKSFLTTKQAVEVDENATFNSISSSKENILKVLAIYESRYPKINFVLDWYNYSSNAFSWESNTQQYVVITGQLARIKNLYTNGMALIIADMITRLVDDKCVAEGDYNALNIMRVIWPNSILATLAPTGISEVENVIFNQIEKHRGGSSNDICDNPSIDCRLESFIAGLSFFPIPECGIPPSEVFTLERAFANFDLTKIEIYFSEAVDIATGSSTINYNINNKVIITSAEVDGNKVELTVEGLELDNRYVMEINNVKSVFEVLIQPNPSLSIIDTCFVE